MRFLVLACVIAAASAAPTANTSVGKITGFVHNFKPVNAEAFLGIPYAKPPLGDLRFKLPEPYGNVGDLSATKYKAICTQPAMSIAQKIKSWFSKEDCLYLNVFRREGTQPNDKKPVAVVIHGGAFSLGGASDPEYNMAPFAALGDVIAVSLNYRLGIFGFANMGELAPGNVGLFDQRMALEWVKDNIEAFGGNPDEITIMGVSAGSASVHAQIVTPLNKQRKLFNAALMDAGILGLALKEETETSLPRIKKIAADFKCPTEGQGMLKCLRGLTGAQLNQAQKPEGFNPLFTFQPTIDGVFIPKHVDEMDASEFANVKLIVGMAKEEGSLFANYYKDGKDFPKLDTEDEFIKFCAKISSINSLQTNFSDPSIREKILTAYYKKQPTQFESITRFVTDYSFICPTKHFVENYVKHNQNVYVYHFERRIKGSYLGLDANRLGAFHGSPFIHFLGVFLDVKLISLDSRDKQFFEESVDTVSKFVKTNHVPKLRGVQWPDFSDEGKVLLIDETCKVADSLPNRENCQIFRP